jgi:hypothetical protein
LGVVANATERAVRGENQKAKTDAIYRASLRGDSTHIRSHAESVALELLKGGIRAEPGKRKVVETRNAIERGWNAVGKLLAEDGRQDLADDIKRFIERMPPPRTEKEMTAAALLSKVREQKVREKYSTRRAIL